MKPPVPCMKVKRPFGEYRLSGEGSGHDRRQRRCQQQGEAPKGEEDEQAEGDQDAEQSDGMCIMTHLSE